MKRLIIALMVLTLCLPIAFSSAESTFSNMSLSELSDLRDRINQEINGRENNNPMGIVETNGFKLTITSIEEADNSRINELYDKYNPTFHSTGDDKFVLLLITFENKTDRNIEMDKMENACINGWVIKGFYGLRGVSIPGHKKANGFLSFKMLDCEAESIDAVNSVEFQFTVEYDGKYSDTESIDVKVIRSDNGFLITTD